MKLRKRLAGFSALMAIVSSPAILAHAGHDHSAWNASLIHAVALVSIIGVAYIGYKSLVAKKISKK